MYPLKNVIGEWALIFTGKIQRGKHNDNLSAGDTRWWCEKDDSQPLILWYETGYWSIFIYVYMTGCVKLLNGHCRTRLDMSRSSLGVVLRGLPARGRSVTFAHEDGSTFLMKVVFCYALPTVVQGFGANEILHFRATTFWAQLLLEVGV
jgi:hypothetical protein